MLHLATPSVAHQERQRQHREELFDLHTVGHMGGFEIESPLLEMAEDLLDPPSLPVDARRFLPMVVVAHEVEEFVPGVGTGDPASGEEQGQPPNRLCLGGPELAGTSAFTGGTPVHKRVPPDSCDILNALVIKPEQPFLSGELPVHGQGADVLRRKDTEETLHQADAMLGVGVASLSQLGQHHPNHRDGHLVDHDGHREDVNVKLSILPVGPVHGENPTVRRLGQLREDQPPDVLQRHGEAQEEVLESAVEALGRRVARRLCGELHQINGAVAEHGNEKDGEAGNPGFVPLKFRAKAIREEGC